MTPSATGAGRARSRLAAIETRPPNWEKIGVILAVLAQLGGAIWFASSVDRRVAAIEQQLPAGIIQRLDERTGEMQATLGRLEGRR